MATVSTLNPGIDGKAVVVAAASGGGDRFSPGTRVHVINGGGAPITATLTTPGNVRGRAIADTVITVPNGTFPVNCQAFDVPVDLYQDPTDGLVGVAWSSATSVTFWVEGPVAS